MLMLLILSSSGVWMTTTNSSRQSSGTLAGSQPVGVCERCVHRCTLSPSWLPLGYLLLRKPLRSDVRPDENPRLGPLR